jgi:hypothetical protein
MLTTSVATGGVGGSISLAVGTAFSGVGGYVVLSAGTATAGGGSVSITPGSGTSKTGTVVFGGPLRPSTLGVSLVPGAGNPALSLLHSTLMLTATGASVNTVALSAGTNGQIVTLIAVTLPTTIAVTYTTVFDGSTRTITFDNVVAAQDTVTLMYSTAGTAGWAILSMNSALTIT